MTSVIKPSQLTPVKQNSSQNEKWSYPDTNKPESNNTHAKVLSHGKPSNTPDNSLSAADHTPTNSELLVNTAMPSGTTEAAYVRSSYRDKAANKAVGELKRQNLSCKDASSISEGDITTRIYMMNKVPPHWIRNTIEKKFKSLHAFQMNILKSTKPDEYVRPSITLGFSRTKSPSTYTMDCSNSHTFQVGDLDRAINFSSMRGIDRKEFTPVQNIVKSAFLYNTSIYFIQHPERIKEAFKDYFELYEDQTVMTTQSGVFDGSVRLSIKKFKKIPPHFFDVPEYNSKKERLPNRTRSLTVRCFGYDPTKMMPELRKPKETKCEPCSFAFRYTECLEHGTYHCPYQKVCTICKGANCLKHDCKHLENINRGDWSSVEVDLKKARKLRNKEISNTSQFKMNRRNGNKTKPSIPSYLKSPKKQRSISESELRLSPQSKSSHHERSSMSQTTEQFKGLEVKQIHNKTGDLNSQVDLESSFQTSIQGFDASNVTIVEAMDPTKIASAPEEISPPITHQQDRPTQIKSLACGNNTPAASLNLDGPIRADGNCLPRCIAKFLLNNQELHHNIRSKAWEHISQNQSDFLWDYQLAVEDTEPSLKFKGSFEQWVNHNKRENVFGGGVMIKAITAELASQVNLIIVLGATLKNGIPYTQMYSHGHLLDDNFDYTKIPPHKIIRLSLIGQHFELINHSDRPCMVKNNAADENDRGTASENYSPEVDSKDNVAESSSLGAIRRQSIRPNNNPYSTSSLKANSYRK